MKDVLQLQDTYYGDILTPGRTDKKINRTDELEDNHEYRSHVGSLNWLTMELSRVLNAPTKIANEIAKRALPYAMRTSTAHLTFSHKTMTGYVPPKTRKKPTDVNQAYETDYNLTDGIQHHEEDVTTQEYKHTGEQLILVAQTDIDLAGQPDTRQSTSAYILYLNGTLFHWRAHTEKLIIKNTMAGEYISLSRGNEACKHVKNLLRYFGNTTYLYYLYTDSQSAEHLATSHSIGNIGSSVAYNPKRPLALSHSSEWTRCV